MAQSDAVILLDSPKLGESEWVEKEIKLAFKFNIPVIWIRFNSKTNRVELPFNPADKPHFILDDFDLTNDDFETDFVDKVIHTAFRTIRSNSTKVFEYINILKDIAQKHDIQLNPVDMKNMIFEIKIPRKSYRYKQLPITQLIQFFGRSPKKIDIVKIDSIICDLGYDQHPKIGDVIDSKIILAPPCAIERLGEVTTNCYIDSFEEYIINLKRVVNPLPNDNNERKKGIIISGAFPNCEPEYQQNLTDAMYSFTQAIFEREATIIFGAHPTFQHFILDTGARVRSKDLKKAIHLYCSKYFVTLSLIEELSEQSNVIATDSINNSRDESLTLMRKKMISDSEAVALIALGGKTDSERISPGVDEEINLAKKAGIPVFLIGSVGGRTSQLTSELNKNNWENHGLNKFSIEDNKELMNSVDYKVLADKILTHLGL